MQDGLVMIDWFTLGNLGLIPIGFGLGKQTGEERISVVPWMEWDGLRGRYPHTFSFSLSFLFFHSFVHIPIYWFLGSF